MVKLVVKPRSRSLKEFNSNYIPSETLLSDLINTIASRNNISVNRLRLTYLQESSTNADDSQAKSKSSKSGSSNRPKHLALSLDKSIAANGLPSGEDDLVTLYVKDLGPQISWRTVFVLEYLGPLLIHPLIYFLTGNFESHSTTQTVSFVLVMLHFLKREYETIFVHKFSLSTMPLFNLFKNSSHYWLLSGFNLAFFIYSKNALPQVLAQTTGIKHFLFYTTSHSDLVNKILIGTWAFAEISNFITHLNLAGLRQSGSTERKIPFGYGFSLVSFPNYFFESLSWLIFALINNNPLSYLFLFVGSLQMMVWAQKKHKRYLKEFGEKYPKNRKIYIPFIF